MEVKNGNARRTETSVRDLLFVVFRQKAVVVAFFLLVVTAVFLVNIFSRSVYQSESKILFRIGRESGIMDPTVSSDVDPIISVGQARDAEIQSYIDILTSKQLAERIVTEIGPEAFLSQSYFGMALDTVVSLFKSTEATESQLLERAVKAFMDNLDVEVNKTSNIISVRFDSYDPVLAQQTLVNLMDGFIEKNLAAFQIPGSLEFFQKQSDELKASVTDYEDKLEDLRKQGIFSDVEERQIIIMKRIDILKQEISSAEFSLSASEAEVRSLQTSLNAHPRSVVTRKMLEDLFDLKIQEQRLLSKYKEDSEPVQAIRREIEKAEAMLAQDGDSFVQENIGGNAVRESLQVSLEREKAVRDSLRAKLGTLRGQLKQNQGELQGIITDSKEAKRLERELKMAEEEYLKYSGKTEMSRINEALEDDKISNVSIIQEPTLPNKSIRPKRVLNMILGVLFGIFGGISLAFVAEYWDQTLKRPEDVEKVLDLPVLISIPLHDKPIRLSRMNGKCRVPSNVYRLFRSLREKLFGGASLSARGAASLMVTSTSPGEGVTSVALDLAYVLTAGGNERVLLVDANQNRPLLHKVFGVSLSPGLIDVLVEKNNLSKHIRRTPISNLDLLTVGNKRNELNNLPEAAFFKSGDFEVLLEAWKKEYDHVVFDAAPVTSDPSMSYLSRIVDGVVWVVEADHVRKQVAQYAADALADVGAKVLGTVFNKRQFYVPKWVYKRF